MERFIVPQFPFLGKVYLNLKSSMERFIANIVVPPKK